MAPIVNVKDVVEENGKTIEENNLHKVHRYAPGQLVYYESREEDGTERLHTFSKGAEGYIRGNFFVIATTRDCDGTPLYVLGSNDVTNFATNPDGSLKAPNAPLHYEIGNGKSVDTCVGIMLSGLLDIQLSGISEYSLSDPRELE